MIFPEYILSILIIFAVFTAGFISAGKFIKKKPTSLQNPESIYDIHDLKDLSSNNLNSTNLHIKAKSLAEDSINEAANIILGTKSTNEHLSENLDKILHQIASQHIHELKETSNNFGLEYKGILQNLENEIKVSMFKVVQEAENEFKLKMDAFLKDLLKQGTSTQAIVDQKTAEMLTIATADLEEYKKLKMSTVDDEIKTLIKKAYKEVLRQSIPENLHHELIVESLENARKDGIFKE